MGSGYSIIPVFIPMLGCSHQCVFCNQHIVTGRAGTVMLDCIKQQLEESMAYVTTASVYREIAFFGGSFTCLTLALQEEILSLAQTFIDDKRIQGIRISTRPDYITTDGLTLLKSHHVKTIELGIQSTDMEVLHRSGRGHSVADIYNAAQLILKQGFNLGLQMMLGLPGDTYQKALETGRNIIAMSPVFVRIYPTLVLKGAPLEELYHQGSYFPLSLDDAVYQAKALKMLFEAHDIQVIRTGLQANEGLDTGEGYVAGPYHPAFGEMVDNAIYLDWMETLLETLIGTVKDDTTHPIILYVSPVEISKALGQKRRNLDILRRKYIKNIIHIQQGDHLSPHHIQVVCGNSKCLSDKNTFIRGYYQTISNQQYVT